MAKDDSPSQPSTEHHVSLNISPERRATYLTRRKEDLKALKIAFEKSDTETIRSIAHRIKGSARLFGFESLELLMLRTEQICATEATPNIQGEIDEFESVLIEADRVVDATK